MKYKVGDKFLMEIEVGRIDLSSVTPYKMLPDGGGWSEAALDDLHRPDDMTAEEAWGIARKICNMEGEQRMVILGDKYYHMAEVYEDFTPQQAKAKMEEWEAAKEIKVGDEVVTRNCDRDEYKFFVTYKDEDEISGFSGFTGDVFFGRDVNYYKKTGRHIDIQGVLEQIGGASARTNRE